MIRYTDIQVGDELRLVGAGAPGFAELGAVVVATKVAGDELEARNAAGKVATFEHACGAARLERVARLTDTEGTTSSSRPSIRAAG